MDFTPSQSVPGLVSANLRMILRGMMAALGLWRLDGAQAILVYRRVSRTIGKIERMLVRFRAGALLRVSHRDVAPRKRDSPKPYARLPRRFGWLVIAGGHQAAGFGCQLQAVMATPEMAELLAASEQARRILRPLCRSLALEVPGVSGAVVADPGERKPRVRKPRVTPEPFRIPLPRGLLSAARRQGFGKMR